MAVPSESQMSGNSVTRKPYEAKFSFAGTQSSCAFRFAFGKKSRRGGATKDAAPGNTQRSASWTPTGTWLIVDRLQHCLHDVRAGRVIRILPERRSEEVTVHLVFATNRRIVPAVRVPIDDLTEHFKFRSCGNFKKKKHPLVRSKMLAAVTS